MNFSDRLLEISRPLPLIPAMRDPMTGPRCIVKPRCIVNRYRRNREMSLLMAPVAPIVHYLGLQVFANELHAPVALAVIE